MSGVSPSSPGRQAAVASPGSRADQPGPAPAAAAAPDDDDAAGPRWVFAVSGARAAKPGEPPDPENAAEVRGMLLAFGLTEAQIEDAAKLDPLLWHYKCAPPAPAMLRAAAAAPLA